MQIITCHRDCPYYDLAYDIYLILKCAVPINVIIYKTRARRGRDRMVVGFTTAYAISACHY
jgi:hypothetical protein